MTNSNTDRLIGCTAIDDDGDKIGEISDVYVDDETGQPAWLAVNTGMFGSKVSFVPLDGVERSGDDVVVPYAKSLVKDAPRAEADGHLSPEEESALYAHYGRSSTTTTVDRTVDADVDRGAGYDTSGPETDDAMTRSEEEVDVGTRSQQTGKARLRKWIETEDVQFTVPVRKEKAVLVTESITDANMGSAMSGADLTTEEHEVTLSEEVIDVDKRVVPKERVRLEKQTETEEVTVDEEVRKERIEMDQDVADRR